jgi:chromosome segregation ATPase
MKSLLFASLILLFNTFSIAQKVVVEDAELEVEKISRPALKVYLELDKKKAEDYWKKYLKQFGKVDSKGDDYTVLEATIPTISSNPVRIVSSISKSKNGTEIVWAIDQGDSWVRSGEKNYNEIKNALRNFGIETYRSEIEEQIKEAEKELKKAEKADEKTKKEGNKLSDDLKKNGEDKTKLEDDLKKNKEDKVKIEQEIEENARDQKAKAEELKKAQEALEKTKAKLDGIK